MEGPSTLYRLNDKAINSSIAQSWRALLAALVAGALLAAAASQPPAAAAAARPVAVAPAGAGATAAAARPVAAAPAGAGATAAQAVGRGLGDLGPAGPAPGPVRQPPVRASAALLADEATGQVLYQRDARRPRPMASTTKVMTALLALERLDQRRVVTIGAEPPRVGEESLELRQGERLTVHQLLLGLLVKSANDAAVALADAVDGSEAAFVRRMNRRAAALRLSHTHYVTAYGLDRPGHQTSARDLAALWEVAMRRADFRALVGTAAARLPGGPPGLRTFRNTDLLLGSYRWTVGGKTGFTNRAGRCLVASASRGGRRLVAVAMGSTDAITDVRALFEFGFSAFVRVRLAASGEAVAAAGSPPAWQAATDVDALVRRDRLGAVTLAVGPVQAGATSPPAAWLLVAGSRLAPLRLRRLPGAGPPQPAGPGGATAGPTTTSSPPTRSPPVPPPTGSPTTGPAGGPTGGGPTGGGPTGGGPNTTGSLAPAAPGATLVAGAGIRPGPAPAGAASPAIDPMLQRRAA